MHITRRQFLRSIAILPAAAALPGPLLRGMFAPAGAGPRNLVLVDLKGGNDGLNMVVPFGVDGGNYYSVFRPTLGIPQGSVLPLSGTVGLNGTMTALKAHFDAGRLAIVQGVGYPNPSFSHDVAQTIWQTGNTAGGSSVGWLARYLQQLGSQPSPNAVAVSDTLTLLLSESGTFVPAFTSLGDFTFPSDGNHDEDKQNRRNAYAAVAAGLSAAPSVDVANIAGTEGSILDLIDLFHTLPGFASVGAYPPQTSLSNALKLTAKLLHSNIGMRYFHLPYGGFDTHADQEKDGYHSKRVGIVSDALAAFHADLTAIGIADDTLVVVFSEFGRTVYENGSGGSDHGYVNPVLVLGNGVVGGLTTAHPSLDPANLTTDGEPPMVADFRDVFGTLVANWLGGDAAACFPGWTVSPVPFLA